MKLVTDTKLDALGLLQVVSWLVAALVIAMNGYLIQDFFSSKVKGVALTCTVSVVTAGYVAFILYLILPGFNLTCRPRG